MESGYKTITPIQLANSLFAFENNAISGQCLRVYFACHAAVAVREAAARSQKRKGRKPKQFARYQIAELEHLTGLPARAVKRSLTLLKRADLINPSEGGLLYQPFPILWRLKA